MRKIGIIIGCLVLGAVVFSVTMKKATDTPVVLSELQEEDVAPVVSTPTLLWAGPFASDAVTLLPNFESFKLSSDASEQNNCDFLSSAGFYTKENKPVGYFYAQEKEYRAGHESALFNGYITANKMGVIRITSILPRDQLVWGLQTGPVLRENGKNSVLRITNDKNARRVFAAVTGDNKLFIAVVYDPLSSFRGPKLVDLPSFVSELEEKTGVVIADAINLDGGSASTFKNEEKYLTELSPVGSFLCIQK